MKRFIPEEHRSRVTGSMIIIAFTALMFAVMYYFKDITMTIKQVLFAFMPFMVGILLAFVQMPMVRNFDLLFGKVFSRKRPHPKLCRVLSTITAMAILLGFLTSFIGILMPQLVISINQIIRLTTRFITNNIDMVSNYLTEHGFVQFKGDEVVVLWTNVIDTVSSYINVVVASAKDIYSSVYQIFFHALIGLITSVYILLDKERLCALAKKVTYGYCSEEFANRLIYWTRVAGRIFSGFIFGKAVDSLIMGILCYICMVVFRMHYALLISVIVGVTNVLPFFGPFIGAIPSALILLIINPYEALGFVVLILILQQLDGNVIGPIILGDQVGLSAFWIMISIVVGSNLFGFTGMVLSVPITALLYAMIKASVETQLAHKGKPIPTEAYIAGPDEQAPDLFAVSSKKKRKNVGKGENPPQ